MASLIKSPKIPQAPKRPEPEDATDAARRTRREVERDQVQTVLTGGQGLAEQGKLGKKTLLGG